MGVAYAGEAWGLMLHWLWLTLAVAVSNRCVKVHALYSTIVRQAFEVQVSAPSS